MAQRAREAGLSDQGYDDWVFMGGMDLDAAAALLSGARISLHLPDISLQRLTLPHTELPLFIQ